MNTNAWYENGNNAMLMYLAEDAAAPELRNPLPADRRRAKWLERLLKRFEG